MFLSYLAVSVNQEVWGSTFLCKMAAIDLLMEEGAHRVLPRRHGQAQAGALRGAYSQILGHPSLYGILEPDHGSQPT